MGEDIGKVEEIVKSLLSGLTSEQGVTMIQSIQSLLNSELIRTNYEVPDMTCPVCGSTECISYGTTRIGTPRWQCKACHHVRCHIETGRILANSKLTKDQWMRFAECFVDHIPSRLVAERVGVCTKTAWFMRLRTLEAIYNNLPSFQVKDGCGVEIDELYFRESFKGTRFDSMDYAPRVYIRCQTYRSEQMDDEAMAVVYEVAGGKEAFLRQMYEGYRLAKLFDMDTSSYEPYVEEYTKWMLRHIIPKDD